MDCDNCKRSGVSVPFIVYEAEMLRSEKRFRRLIVVLVVAIFAVFASNVAWLMYLTQYESKDNVVGTDSEGTCFVSEKGQPYDATTEIAKPIEESWKYEGEHNSKDEPEKLKRGGS